MTKPHSHSQTSASSTDSNTPQTSNPSHSHSFSPHYPSSLNTDLQFLHAYGPKRRISMTFPEQGVTKQSFKDECDINVIMRRFEATGELPLNQRPMLFGDVPAIDFQGAMAVVVDARERFQALPAEIRDRFNNDPQRLINFLQEEKNRTEAEALGLVRKRQDQSAPAAGGTPPAPAATAPSASSQAGEAKKGA